MKTTKDYSKLIKNDIIINTEMKYFGFEWD